MQLLDISKFKSNTTLELNVGDSYYLSSKGKPASFSGVLQNFRLSSPNPAGKATIICEAPVWDAITLAKGSSNVHIDNIVMSTSPKCRALRLEGEKIFVSNFSITDNCLVGIYLNGVTNSAINDCTQRKVTRGGFIYASSATDVLINNVTTFGNYYENDVRLHGCTRVRLRQCNIFGMNPENDLPREHGDQYAGLKDNALRFHDSQDCSVENCTIVGNVRIGPMGDADGGLVQYQRSQDSSRTSSQRKADKADWQRMMALRSTGFNMVNTILVGWLRLEAGLTDGRFVGLNYYSLGGPQPMIRNDGTYAAGGMVRPAPKASFNACYLVAPKIPGSEKKNWKIPNDIITSALTAKKFEHAPFSNDESTLLINTTSKPNK